MQMQCGVLKENIYISLNLKKIDYCMEKIYFPSLTAGLNLNPISPQKSLHIEPNFYFLIF